MDERIVLRPLERRIEHRILSRHMGPLETLYNWLLGNLHWILIAICVHGIVLGTVAYLILAERKVAAWAQDRIGPNRTGFSFGIIPFLARFKFWGLGQSFADGIKMFTKEDFRSPNTDRVLFSAAPIVMMTVIVVSIAVIPWGGSVGNKQEQVDITDRLAAGRTIPQSIHELIPRGQQLLNDADVYASNPQTDETVRVAKYLVTGQLLFDDGFTELPAGQNISVSFADGWKFQIASLNIGVLFILATLSLAVYGVTVGGYAGNNKYSFLGGLRATANMISYEIPLGLLVLCVVLVFSTLDLGTIVTHQADYWLGVIPKWNVLAMPVVFILFLVCIHAEANRAPFDIAEAEQELVGGYHTEYTSMRLGLLLLAEYAGMITTSAFCVALFFGGWHLPWVDYLWTQLRGNVSGNVAISDNVWMAIFRSIIFFGKTIFVLFIFLWVRWSLPRFRFDQIMNLAWRMLIPLSLLLAVGTAIGVFVCRMYAGGDTVNGLGWLEALGFLLINLSCAVIAYIFARFFAGGREYTNKRIEIDGSRFTRTALPAGVGRTDA